MLEELKSERLVKKVGGRFKLAALVQRRLVELLQGSRPLIENAENMTAMEIVLQEILQDKITMDTSPNPDRRPQPIIERRDDDDDDEPRGRSRL
jgi:DNA-directed RNA polymerase subunit omega